MKISIHDCTFEGQVVFSITLLLSFTFVLSVIVLGNNQKEDWRPTWKQELLVLFIQFYFPRDSIQERVAGWYLPYKISGILVLPFIALLVGGVHGGFLCEVGR